MMTPKISVVLGGGYIHKALCNRLTRIEGLEDSQVRSSPVVMSSLEDMNEASFSKKLGSERMDGCA